jgi:anti-sigma B factor antagonist
MGAKIKISKIDDGLVLELHGKVSSEDAIKISKKLEAFVKKSVAHVVVDLARIDFLDSHWLGVFVYSWKLYKENGKELVFLIPQGFIYDLFRNSNLDKAFRIISSLNELYVPSAAPASA